MIHLGCAGWSLPSRYAEHFPQSGSHLQRYAGQLNAVEINSSFYRPHRPETYARWASSVPEDFRFAVKVPKRITHELRLQGCESPLAEFLAQCGQLGSRLGCLLIQLPPSLIYDYAVARRFFERVRECYEGPLALEPRHSSWHDAQALLMDQQVAQVAANPARFGTDASPAGWPGLSYWRLHGEPRIYHSEYSGEYLNGLAEHLRLSCAAGHRTWCIFDNTASGAATANALQLQRCLSMQAG